MSLIYSLSTAFLRITFEGLELYKTAVIVSIILSWLVNFNIINVHNRFVRSVGGFLYRITEPALAPLRRIIPPMGGLDLSPIALFFIIHFIQLVIQNQAMRMGL